MTAQDLDTPMIPHYEDEPMICAVCERPITEEDPDDGAQTTPSGEFVHPFPSMCHATAWTRHPSRR